MHAVAKDGQEALDKVRKSMKEGKRFNLIFMDVQASEIDVQSDAGLMYADAVDIAKKRVNFVISRCGPESLNRSYRR